MKDIFVKFVHYEYCNEADMIREEEVTQNVIKWHLLISFVIGNHKTFRSLLSFFFSGWID